MAVPFLKLTRPSESRTCLSCGGTGKVQLGKTYTASGKLAPGDGQLIPCPKCKGKKVFPEFEGEEGDPSLGPDTGVHYEEQLD